MQKKIYDLWATSFALCNTNFKRIYPSSSSSSTPNQTLEKTQQHWSSLALHSHANSPKLACFSLSHGRKNNVRGGDFPWKAHESRERRQAGHRHPLQARIAAPTPPRTSPRRPRPPHRVPPIALPLPLRSLRPRSQIPHRVSTPIPPNQHLKNWFLVKIDFRAKRFMFGFFF